jgi:hypothetical protein
MTLSIIVTTLVNGWTGLSYSTQFEATGGTPPYVWSIAASPGSGQIPPTWVAINANTGIMTGTPNAGGIVNLAISVTDSASNQAHIANTLSIIDISSSASYMSLITSEHNQKPNFMTLVGVLTAGLGDATEAIANLIPEFSLDTAVGAQLDIVGLWIGQSRVIPNVLLTGFFGFSEVSTGDPDGLQEPFGELTNPSIGGVWYSLGQTSAGTTVLSDSAYLTLLKAKIVQNQWDGTLSGMEEALQFILGVACSIADPGDLKLTINVPLPITPLEQALISSLDIVPRPAGVQISSITFAS